MLPTWVSIEKIDSLYPRGGLFNNAGSGGRKRASAYRTLRTKVLRPLDKLPFERESGHESVHFEYVVLMRFSVGEEKDL
jgi:hypothetical protein